MKVIEDKLNELLVAKMSYKLPDNGKKMLVSAMPWLALAGGVLSLIGAWSVYQLTMWSNGVVNVTNQITSTYGYGNGYNVTFGPLLWVSMLLLLVEGVMFFAAFSPLKEHKKKGWDLVYWVSLLNVVYAMVYLVASFNWWSFLFSLVGSVIGLYLLFQIRSQYSGASTSEVKK